MQSRGTEHNKNNCLVCGGRLLYFDTPVSMECCMCGQQHETQGACEQGHFICNECHQKDGAAMITAICSTVTDRNPIRLAMRLMKEPSIHMHGPEHHVLVGAVLLACYANSGGKLSRTKALQEMERRGKQVPGGACGFWGCCGAAVSAGIAMSILTEATPLKQEEWGLSNRMTAGALQAIGEIGGPRCCKRDSFTAIVQAVRFIRETLGVEMELPEEIQCGFSPLNEQCIQKRCPYHLVEKSAVQ